MMHHVEQVTKPRTSTFRALEHPEFRRFWIAQAFSLIGSWLQTSAQGWLVLGLYPGNPALATERLGFLSALQWTPSLLLSLFAGAILDRVSRKAVLITTQITLMLTAVALGLAVLTNRVSFEVVAVISLVTGLANVFDIVARQSLVPNLVPRESMANAVALNSLSFNTARVLGGSLFGLLAPLIGIGPLFFLNAASFLGVIGAIASLKSRPIEAHNENILEDVRIGLRYVFATPAVRGPILLLAALSLTVINFQVIIPSFARFALDLKEAGFGLLGSSFGLGAALGAAFSASRQGSNRSRMMLYGSVLLTLGVGILAITPNLFTASLALLAAGAGMILFTVSANSSVQLSTPDRLRGRVMSVYTLVFAGMSPAGSLLVGFLMARLGARAGVAVLAGLALISILALRPRPAKPSLESRGP
jgi:MFS family permease